MKQFIIGLFVGLFIIGLTSSGFLLLQVDDSQDVLLTQGAVGEPRYDDIWMIARMVAAEARGEPYLGQVAVGAVIINRILSPQFPDTLRGVLFQRNAFQPISNGSFYMTPNESARRAAMEALNGHDPTGGALFFFNPRQSNDRFMHSRPTKMVIGSHRFTY